MGFFCFCWMTQKRLLILDGNEVGPPNSDRPLAAITYVNLYAYDEEKVVCIILLNLVVSKYVVLPRTIKTVEMMKGKSPMDSRIKGKTLIR